MRFLSRLAGVVALCAGAGLMPALAQNTSVQASANVNFSGTVTTGGTFQTFVTVNGGRRSIEFVNICNVTAKCTMTTNFCYLYIGSGTPTTSNSIPVGPGLSYLRSTGNIPSSDIKITCDGNADKFYLVVQ